MSGFNVETVRFRISDTRALGHFLRMLVLMCAPVSDTFWSSADGDIMLCVAQIMDGFLRMLAIWLIQARYLASWSVGMSVSRPVCTKTKSVGQWMLLAGFLRRLLLGAIQARYPVSRPVRQSVRQSVSQVSRSVKSVGVTG